MASGSTSPAEGERRAMVGYGGQYALAAQAVLAHLPSLEWIRVADPSVGAADDFQFMANGVRHAIQVKWSQYPGVFTWADLTSPGDASSLIGSLAAAWSRIRRGTAVRPRIHLRTNDNPHSDSRRPPPAFATATTSAPKHFAAFLATSVIPAVQSYREGKGSWDEILGDKPHIEWRTAWGELLTAVGLPDGDEFPDFLADLQLEFRPLDEGAAVERPNGQNIDLEHLAAQLQRLVTLPSRKVEYSKRELLAELGWTDRAELLNPHQFPMPIAYGANATAYDALRACLGSHDSGYVALVGPAGCGKSTLLQDLETPGRVIRYFSFVPDSAVPFSSRGEAVSFLHDLTLSLEHAGLWRHGAPSDLASLQSCLRQQLAQAGTEFIRSGRRTTVIIDGIDHIGREQHPVLSLVDVLPAPASLPSGVVFVIGSQSLNDLPEPIRAQLGSLDRTVELPPLSGAAVARIVELAGLEAVLRPHQRSKVIAVSEGHPLSLAYLIEELKAALADNDRVFEAAVDSILDSAAGFGRDVERRYRGYLASSQGDSDVMRILAITSRLQAPVDLRWVSCWTKADALRRFEHHARPYFRVDGSVWRFVHNSFRMFLARETASTGGGHDSLREQQIEAEIADICGSASDDWRVYRDEELVHRHHAGQVDRVLERTRPAVLRRQLEALRPSGLVRSDLMVGLHAAAGRMDTRALVAGLQFAAELAIRDDLLPPERLAEALIDTNPRRPDLPLLLNSSQSRLSWVTAMRLAARLVQRGATDQAQEVLRAAGGVAGARQSSSPKDAGRAVRDWAYCVCAISGHDAVVELVARHLSTPEESNDDDDGDTPEYWRSVAYAGATDCAGDLHDDAALGALGEVVMSSEPLGWRLRYLARRASIAIAAGDAEAAQTWVDQYVSLRKEARKVSGAYDYIDTVTATILVRLGGAPTAAFRDLIPVGWLPAWPDPLGRDGDEWREFATVVMARSLQLVRQWVSRDAAAPDLPPFGARPDAGQTRYLQALDALAEHYASQLHAGHVGAAQPPWIVVDPVFRLLELPSIPHDWHGWHRVSGNYSDMLKEFIGNCSKYGGSDQLARLFEYFQSIWSTPDRLTYWPERRRLQVLEGFLDADHATMKPLVEPVLIRLDEALGSIEDDEDAITCALLAAGLWSRCGRQDRVQPSLEHAVRRSCGSHHYDESRSLLQWSEWLLALPQLPEWPDQYRRFAARLVACDPSLSTEVAKPLVRSTWARDRRLAYTSAEWFCTNGLMAEREIVEALVLGMCADPQVPAELLASVASEMLLPIMIWPAEEAMRTLEARLAGTPWAEALHTATAIWRPAVSVERLLPQSRDQQGEEANVPDVTKQGPNGDSLRSTAAILAALRECTQAQDAKAIDLAGDVTESVISTAQPLAIRAILIELQRLGMADTGVGIVVRHAIAAGVVDVATEVLRKAARNLPVEGWRPYWDGGSRLRLFEAACALGSAEARKVAASDLVNCISGSRHSTPSIATTLRIARLLGGEQAVVDGWEDAQQFLDLYAPVQVEQQVPHPVTQDASAEAAVLDWVSQYVSHPVRTLDFGARSVLRRAVELAPTATQTVLTAAMSRGPQFAEAALDVLVGVVIPSPIHQDFADALRATILATDQINRVLGARVANAHRIAFEWPPERDLPALYRLELPPLPEESLSPLGSDNMPLFDPAHPEHRLQPYDDLLRMLARAADLDDAVVLSHAANQRVEPQAEWLEGGVQGLKAWLGSRGQRHMFRPWAYMHGRRAASRVFAELCDARALAPEDMRFFTELLIASGRQFPGLESMDGEFPLPWRTEGTRDYDMTSWISESEEAAAHYRDYYATRDETELIVAESVEWISSNSGNHRELRKVVASHAATAGPILMPSRKAWEDTTLTPAIVASSGRHLDWRHEELTIRGWDRFGDGPLVTSWLAFHPVAATKLGWTPAHSGFEWTGSDGTWRARSRRIQRGSTTGDGQLPNNSYCGGGWQVILSAEGWLELNARWPIVRQLKVRRESDDRRHPESALAKIVL